MENPFGDIHIDIDGNNMAQVQPPPPPPGQQNAAAVPVADVQQVVGPLVQAIVQGNQNIIASQENLERSRRFVDRVPSCDGEDVAGLREWVKELALIPLDQRLDVLLMTARGPLLRAAQLYHENHPGCQWEAMKTHLLQPFVSQLCARSCNA